MGKLRSGTFVTAAAFMAIVGVAAEAARASSANGRIAISVWQALAIESLSDMAFAGAEAGSPAATVIPSPTNNSGAFAISGSASATYTVRLPREIRATIGKGGKDETIVVRDFRSFPPTSGVLNPAGGQTVYIGATRSALTRKQKPGRYVGNYTLEVIY